MTALVGIAAFLAGWAVRGALSEVIYRIVMRVFTSSIGKEKVRAMLLRRLTEGDGPGITEPAKEVHLAGHLRRCKARATGYFKDCDCYPQARQ